MTVYSTSETNPYPEAALPERRPPSPAENLALRTSTTASEPLGLQDRPASIVPTGPLGLTPTNVNEAKPTKHFFSRIMQSVGTVTKFLKKGTKTPPPINLPIEGQEPRFVVVNPDGTVPEKPIDAETRERINLPIEEGRGPRFVVVNPDGTVPEKSIDAETGERINLHEEKERRREDRITLLLQAKANRESKREAFVPEKPITATSDYDFDIVEVEPAEERSGSAAKPDTPPSSAKAHKKRQEMEIEAHLKSTADTSTKHVKKKPSEGAENVQTNPEKKQKSEHRTFTWLRRRERARGD